MKTLITPKSNNFIPFVLNIEIETKEEYEILHRIFNQHEQGGSEIVNDRYADHAKINPKAINIVTDAVYYALEKAMYGELTAEKYQENFERVFGNIAIKKPPLGVLNHNLWIQHRTIEVWNAIQRYEAVNKPYPAEWKAELQTHIMKIKDYLTEEQFNKWDFNIIYDNIITNG